MNCLFDFTGLIESLQSLGGFVDADHDIVPKEDAV